MRQPALRLRGVLETALYADDLDAAEQFYRDVIGLDVLFREEGRHVFFRCGTGVVLVFDPVATRAGDTLPPHGADGPGHVAFAVPHEALDDWKAHLEARGIAVEKAVTWPNGGQSLYVRDPARNSIELATPDLWGEAPRDDRLRQIRPAASEAADDVPPMERFARQTLKPICALQTPLVLRTVARHLQQHDAPFSRMRRADQEAMVRRILHDDRLKRSLVGLIAGHFTADEYVFYLDHEREVHRRLARLLIPYVLDRLDALSLEDDSRA